LNVREGAEGIIPGSCGVVLGERLGLEVLDMRIRRKRVALTTMKLDHRGVAAGKRSGRRISGHPSEKAVNESEGRTAQDI
jgi:hypothetical protein